MKLLSLNAQKMKPIFFNVALTATLLVFAGCAPTAQIVEAPTPPAEKADLIVVASPLPNATVSNPLQVTGEARGYWFFEASFPIRLEDENGNVLVQSIGTAQGEWMTEEFVPFTATLEFDPGTSTSGVLILEKDNPSGMPENADSLEIPVQF